MTTQRQGLMATAGGISLPSMEPQDPAALLADMQDVQRRIAAREEGEQRTAAKKEVTTQVMNSKYGEGSKFNFAPGVGSQTSEGKEMARFDKNVYGMMNKVFGDEFTKADNKFRRLDSKLQKLDGRGLADKLGNKLRKRENKARKKIKKALGL